jgi:hypothetical protein
VAGLRQQPKDLNAVGFDILVKRWDKCNGVGGGYVKKKCSSRLEYHMFYALYPFVTCLLTLPHIKCLPSNMLPNLFLSPYFSEILMKYTYI